MKKLLFAALMLLPVLVFGQTGAYSFNGTSSYLANAGYFWDGNSALFLRYYPTYASNDTNGHQVYSLDGGSGKLIIVDHNTSANFRGGWYNAGINALVTVSDPSTQNAWNSILLVARTSGATTTDKMWINGVSQGTAAADSVTWNPENTEVNVGRLGDGTQFFAGRIATLTVWGGSSFVFNDSMALAMHRGAPATSFDPTKILYHAPFNGISTNFWYRNVLWPSTTNHGQGFSTTNMSAGGGPPILSRGYAGNRW